MTDFTERFFFNHCATTIEISKHLHSEKSPFQQIDVYETPGVGKLLTLNGKTMVSDKDEFVYHEVLSHVPYMVSRDAKRVLIIGGGDGGLVREFCRYSQLEAIDLVEIDQRVIDVSRQYFPELTISLDDPRVRVLAEDGVAFIKTITKPYDIIVIDSTDPEDFASGLFTQEFYSSVMKALTPAGIMVAQTENPFFDQYDVKSIYKNLKQAFPLVSSFTAPMVIYPGVFWTFAFASKQYRPWELYTPHIEQFQKIADQLKWYHTNWHRGAFCLSQFHQKRLGLEDQDCFQWPAL
jgi:spermidine synthase